MNNRWGYPGGWQTAIHGKRVSIRIFFQAIQNELENIYNFERLNLCIQ